MVHKSASHKKTNTIWLNLYKVSTSHVCKVAEWNAGFQCLGRGGNVELLFNRCIVSVWEMTVLYMDGGGWY